MKSQSEYDGAIFTPAQIVPDDLSTDGNELCGVFENEPRRNDAIAWAEAIRDEVREWKESSSPLVSKSAKRTADALIQHCYTVVVTAKRNGKPQPNGLTPILTPAALIELGYLLCQFRIQANGFERFAGIGLKQHGTQWKTGEQPSEKARKLYAAGKRARIIERHCKVKKSVAERWCRQMKEENS